MEKILGLDLGSNSIGWSIRNAENSEIVDYGVVVFKTGVGTNKDKNESRAKERRSYRGKRRLYNAKRYRKWALLKVLIKNKMCPSLSETELRLWSIGEWTEENGRKINKGRKYPMNEEFLLWLRMDDKYFGNKGISENGKEIRKSPYDLRCELLESFIEKDIERNYRIGRALYHLCQRRGFKSSRKGGKSAFKPDETFDKAVKENANVTPAQIWNKDLEEKNIRIRGRGKIDREEFVKEFRAICEKQHLEKELSEALYNAIYFVRKLRSQKGLIGKCTLEKGKPRIPISHPLFEEFRALQFVNNIKKRSAGRDEEFESITMDEKKKIFSEMFFKKSRIKTPNFKFEEITNKFSEKGKYEFNYERKNPSVSACPFIAGLMDVLNEEWSDKFITDENRFGINWSGLQLKYKVAYGNQQDKERILKIDYFKNDESLWHLIFDFVQTQDNDEKLLKFLTDVVGLNIEKAKCFTNIKVAQGYGSLSSSAIRKIIPYLQDGYIYSEAVSFANLKTVLGEENFNKNKDIAKSTIAAVICRMDEEKEKLNIVNGLIQQHYAITKSNKAPGLTDDIKEQAIKDIEKKFLQYFGETNWNKFPDEKKKQYQDFVTKKYCNFLDGKQQPVEKAAYKPNKEEPPTDYYRLPRLDKAIKDALSNEPFNATKENLEKLYHPSDIEIYPPASEKEIIDKSTGEVVKIKELPQPMPPSKGWKNPMAMRTMHELRTLVNYLLSRKDKEDKPRIDEETKIVIEVARDLNDANMRKAISDWNDDREKENEEYKAAIAELYQITSPSNDNYDKFRLALEQIEKIEIDENKESSFKKKYDEFVKTYITGEIKKEIDEDAEIVQENSESDKKVNTKISDEYLMYMILYRERFNQLLNYKIPNSRKFIKQIIKPVKDYKKRRDDLKEMLLKYRLWKQQKFQCFYTGRHIPLTDLFTEKYQIEHTIPRSISFDSELRNLTICNAEYNNYIKDNGFPTDCLNHNPHQKNSKTVFKLDGKEVDCGYIIDRVNRFLKPKVDELEARIKNLKYAAKSIPDWETERKNANIRLRHYLEFEYGYWKKKYDTFTIERKDWKDKMKNSQLVDTQLVSKYARAYMKSLFNRVDVQKGEVTAQYRKIFGLPKKSRENHAHHAIDAMVLTLIPGSAHREAILKTWYELQECEKSVKSRHEKQARIDILKKQLEEELNSYNLPYIREKNKQIKSNVIINHVSKDRTLIHTKKKARKRGKIDFIRDKKTKAIQYEIHAQGNFIYQTNKKGEQILQKDKNGNLVTIRKKKTKYIQGDSVRGELHQQTFYGAILKRPILNEKGRTVKELKDVERKNKKTGQIEKLKLEVYKFIELKEPAYTLKTEISKLTDTSKIVDPVLIDTILNQIENENKKLGKDDFYYLGNKLRHIKIFANASEPIKVRKHIFISEKNTERKEHKHWVYATNRGNYCLCIYRGKINEGTKKEKIETIVDLHTIRELGKQIKASELKNIKIDLLVEQNKIVKNELITIYHILKTGDKILFYQGEKKEAKEAYNKGKNLLQKMLYRVTDLETKPKNIKLKQCIESRENKNIKDKEGKEIKGTSNFDFSNPPALWRGVFDTLEKNAMFERLDFEIKPDGEIEWNF